MREYSTSVSFTHLPNMSTVTAINYRPDTNTHPSNTTKRPHPTLSRSARLSRAHDIADGSAFATSTTSSDDSSPSADEHDDQLEQAISPTPDASVMYSFDASRGPSHGSQILNVALAKAIEKYEDKQTDKLVRSEWEVVDEDGESSGVGSKKGRGRGKGKVLNADEVATKAAEDEDYEFV